MPSESPRHEALVCEVRERRERLTEIMKSRGLDSLMVASEANAFYLTGYETTLWGNKSKPFAVIFAPPERPKVVCHVGEQVSVELDAIDVDVHPYTGPVDVGAGAGVQLDYHLPAAETVAAVLAATDVLTVGIEDSWHFMPGFTPRALERLTSGFAGTVLDGSPAIWQARRCKSTWEIEQMRLAAGAAELTHALFAAAARVGQTERELNRLLRRCAHDAGAERVGYSGIIAGVDRAPLGGPTDRRWERGQLLFVDICLQLNGGYFADFNRIYANATPTADQRRGYEVIVEALRRGSDEVRAGAPVGAVADAIIGETTTIYARVGHGLGLEMPEPPSLSPLDPTPLAAGEVICVEPNLHVDGVGWLVSEEEVVVTTEGHERISPPFPRELEVIGGDQRG